MLFPLTPRNQGSGTRCVQERRIPSRSHPHPLPPGDGSFPQWGEALGVDRTSEPMRLLPHWDAPAHGSGRPSPARGRGSGGEGQPAHPNAIKPLDAHVFCPPLNGGRLGGGRATARGARGSPARVRVPFAGPRNPDGAARCVAPTTCVTFLEGCREAQPPRNSRWKYCRISGFTHIDAVKRMS